MEITVMINPVIIMALEKRAMIKHLLKEFIKERIKEAPTISLDTLEEGLNYDE